MPDYVCRIARAIKRSGKSTSQAISIAVSRVKMWASGKGVDKDTQAKAAEAVAGWEALRVKSHAKTAAKHAVKASYGMPDGLFPAEILCLTNIPSFNTELVRQAWSQQSDSWEQQHQGGPDDNSPVSPTSGMPGAPVSGPSDEAADVRANSWIRELWTDFIIVSTDDGDLYRVDYEIGDPDNDGDTDVTFDDPVPVKVQYVAMSACDMVGHEISDAELLRMIKLTPACQFSAVQTLMMSVSQVTSAGRQAASAVQKFLALADEDTKNISDG